MPIVETARTFVKNWDLSRTRVIRPARLVFLCGGLLGNRDAPPISARDALLRLAGEGYIGGAKIVLAETANNTLPNSSFTNLLDLEEGIGAIVDGVILFVESPGSICELGAFCKIPDIADRLTTFVMNEHAIKSSFVRNGPLKYLLNADGTENFSVFDWSFGPDGLRIADFVIEEILAESETAAMARPATEAFSTNSAGHLTYTILAISFALRGGLLSEIKECARVIWPYLAEKNIRNALDVLQIVELIEPVTNGRKTYYIPKIERINLDITLIEEGGVRDPVRWLSDIVAEIRKEDRHRLDIFGEHNAS